MAYFISLDPPRRNNYVETLPHRILFEELRRFKPMLEALKIGFSISRVKVRVRNGKPRKPPYFACCYNIGDLGNLNVVAFYYPLLADWEMMEREVGPYRQRIRAALQEEVIHGVQVMTVGARFRRSSELQARFAKAEHYYEHLLGQIIGELATRPEGRRAVLTAAQLYYEDWSITSLEKLRQTDQRLHGRAGYLATELIRQLVQIRFGELTSEEAKGKAWDKNRVFNAGSHGTTENLLKAMVSTLRQATPVLVSLSPVMAGILAEIENTLRTLRQTDPTFCEPYAPIAWVA
ncbi:MAG TPA: hypothetical protein VGD78_11070 [Chthoniobacterales bacterium]